FGSDSVIRRRRFNVRFARKRTRWASTIPNSPSHTEPSLLDCDTLLKAGGTPILWEVPRCRGAPWVFFIMRANFPRRCGGVRWNKPLLGVLENAALPLASSSESG